MDNYIFIPDNNSLFTLDGVRKGTIHYKYNNSPYHTVSWSIKKKLLYKINTSSQFDKKTLSFEEKIEYRKMAKYFKTPKENIIKNCIVVIINKKMAIGLNRHYMIAFKSFNLNKIKAICKKYHVITYFDNKLALDLFCDGKFKEGLSFLYPDIKMIGDRIFLWKNDKIFKREWKLILGPLFNSYLGPDYIKQK